MIHEVVIGDRGDKHAIVDGTQVIEKQKSSILNQRVTENVRVEDAEEATSVDLLRVDETDVGQADVKQHVCVFLVRFHFDAEFLCVVRDTLREGLFVLASERPEAVEYLAIVKDVCE